MNPNRLKAFFVLFLGGMLALHGYLVWANRTQLRNGYQDFTIFYAAGKALRQGLGPELYSAQLQYRIERGFAASVTLRKGPLPYNHPPFEALLIFPFTWLPFFEAYLLWNLFGLAALWGTVLLLRRQSDFLRRVPVVFLLLTTLAFFPVFLTLFEGQDSILLLLVFTLGFASLKSGAEGEAGAWLAAGLFRFQFVLPMVLILAWRRRRILLGFVPVAAALVVLSVIVVGWRQTVLYPRSVWSTEMHLGGGAIVPTDFPNLRGLITILLPPGVSIPARRFLVIGISGLLLLFALRRCEAGQTVPRLDFEFSWALLISVLVSYHASIYDLSLLVLPIALLAGYSESFPQEPSKLTGIALLAPAALLFITPIYLILWISYGRTSLLAVVLLFWLWGWMRWQKAVAAKAISS